MSHMSINQEGEWILKNGTWFRRDYYSIMPGEEQTQTVKVKCPNCPTYQEQVAVLTSERDELQRMVSEHSQLIQKQQQRINSLESLQQHSEFSKNNVSVQGLQERDHMIAQLTEKLQKLTFDTRKTEYVKSQEQMVSIRVATPVPRVEYQPPLESRHCVGQSWFYQVQSSDCAELLKHDPHYHGGEIMVDSMEGATVVNPDYYEQSDNVPGTCRLRVRVVELTGLQSHTRQEVFIRIRLGDSAQYSQPHVSHETIAWRQDFVFVSVPVCNSPTAIVGVSINPLCFEVIARLVGGTEEEVLGNGSIDISDLQLGLTRAVAVSLLPGGATLHARIKALDFGLAPPREHFQPPLFSL